MRELRAKSGHAEEIGLELIDISKTPIEASLHSDGIPSLMFKTRELMRKRSAEMPAWISPDFEVEAGLRTLLTTISDREQREFSRRILEPALNGLSGGSPDIPLPRPKEGVVRVHNVRNIADAELLISTEDYACVIHGPNGTGKSSLFEAVSIALLGTSKRHGEYIQDRDVMPGLRSNYTAEVLRRFGTDTSDQPTILVDEVDVSQT